MDHPAPSDDGSWPSRQGSHAEPEIQAVPPHPRHVEPRRESVPIAPSFPASYDMSYGRNGQWPRSSKSIELGKNVDMNEQSPLLRPRPSGQLDNLPALEPIESPVASSEISSWIAGTNSMEESKSSWYLFLLTLTMGGLQIAWSVELSNGSPYLLSLGISKSFLALVWIAGPLSGTLVQPYVGVKSDRCRFKFGKRRPFIVGGGIATVISIMLLAWTRELIGAVLSIFGVSRDSKATANTAIVFAVIMIYILDFSINVIQAGVRAFIVDNTPTHQQDAANAWASRISGIGNIVGYLFGYADLPKVLWFFGNTQFKVLCVIASLSMLITLSISCLSITERDPRLEGLPADQAGGVFAFFKQLYQSIRRLPRQINRVCQVQFFAWIGWFPFLFYITTYIGQIYVNPIFAANPNMTPDEIDDAWERGTRVATFALEIFAITTFVASVVLPWFITSSYHPPSPDLQTPMNPGATTSATPINPTTPTPLIASGYFEHPIAHASFDARSRFTRFLARRPLQIPGLTLRRAWLFSHLLFALFTWLTFLARSTTSATILVAFVGIPWAMTCWAPFALIAAEISKRDRLRRGLARPPPTRDGEALARGEDPSAGADQAGTVLGIHNVAIAAPQVIATLVSSAIFRALQKPRGSVGDDSVGWVLRFGGCAALVAAYLTRRVGEEGEEEGGGDVEAGRPNG